ncbi:MAG: hypothetical protein JWL83_3138 [Actinomycetia bacterium]|nr:hypothetical protein [Actinomycetes bacterium]
MTGTAAHTTSDSSASRSADSAVGGANGKDAGEQAEHRFDVRWAIFAAFVLVVGVTMWRHEMWRDELQAWMIARASHSLPDLFNNIRYEGHPALWYLLLWPLAKINTAPWMMQLAQLTIAALALALVLWRAPFTNLQKALFAGGYFVVFEYGTLSRSYSLGFLFVAATCAVASTRHRWPWCGVTLALLALTSAFDALLAVALLVGLLVDAEVRRRQGVDVTPFRRIALGFALAVGGLTVAYAQASPPGDAGVYRSWNTSFNSALARTSLAAISRAVVPIPKFRREWWNTSIFDGATTAAAVLGVLIVLGIAWLLRRRPGACATWVAGVALVVGFLYSKIQYASASRYNGHIFLALVAALWLVPSMATIGRSDDRRSVSLRTRLWTAILVLQLIGGMFVVLVDWKYPFSNGRDVADLINARHLQHAIIIGQPDVSASTVAAYLNHDVYYPAGERFGRYILWDQNRKDRTAPLREIIRRVEHRTTEAVLLVINHPVDVRVFTEFRLEPLAAFDNGIVPDEHFWVYRVIGLTP